MNRIIALITCLILTISLTCSSQNYIPLPEDSAVWRVYTIRKLGYSSSCSRCYKDRTMGDTVINTKNFTKIYRNGIADPYCYVKNGYIGAIRNDTINKKVYFVPAQSDSVHLLYDISLQVGDTFNNYSTIREYVVDSIDSIYLNDERQHKEIYFKDAYRHTIIEGIGSTSGLLEPFVEFESGQDLVCFKNKDSLIYPKTYPIRCDTFLRCDTTTGIKKKSNKNIQVSPNPFTQNFQLTIPKQILKNGLRVIIKDIYGRKIYIDRINKSRTNIKLSNIPEGILILQLKRNDRAILTRKILKQ